MFTFVHLLRAYKKTLKLKFSWKCYVEMFFREITEQIETLDYLMLA